MSEMNATNSVVADCLMKSFQNYFLDLLRCGSPLGRFNYTRGWNDWDQRPYDRGAGEAGRVKTLLSRPIIEEALRLANH